jgi:hypothetical protein
MRSSAFRIAGIEAASPVAYVIQVFTTEIRRKTCTCNLFRILVVLERCLALQSPLSVRPLKELVAVRIGRQMWCAQIVEIELTLSRSAQAHQRCYTRDRKTQRLNSTKSMAGSQRSGRSIRCTLRNGKEQGRQDDFSISIRPQ